MQNTEYKMDKPKVFRLAAILYADNNYDVSSSKIIEKIAESIFLYNNNEPLSIGEIIEFCKHNYGLIFSEDEIQNIFLKEKVDRYIIIDKSNKEISIRLTARRLSKVSSKAADASIDKYIEDFSNENEYNEVKRIKDTIYRFLYNLLCSNINNYGKLLSNGKSTLIDEVAGVNFIEEEKSIINKFLEWDNDSKNKIIFDIVSYALEYCIITNNKEYSSTWTSEITNKVFYLDTNIIFRAIGINGESRKKLIADFLNKCIESREKIVISKFTQEEFFNSIDQYIKNIYDYPRKVISPDLFKKNSSHIDIHQFYNNWRYNRSNDSLELFKKYIRTLYFVFIEQYNISIEGQVPFDETETHTKEMLEKYESQITQYKDEYSVSANSYDAKNVYLIERKRGRIEDGFLNTRHFFISTDQRLQAWDINRNRICPIIFLPSQWLSLFLKYVSRTNDDYRSFVNFITLKSNYAVIDENSLSYVLAGISEITDDFEKQQLIFDSFVSDGIQKTINDVSDKEKYEKAHEYAYKYIKKEIEFTHKEIKEKDDLIHSMGNNYDILKEELKTKEIENLEIQELAQGLATNSKKDGEEINNLTKNNKTLADQLVEQKLFRWKLPAIAMIPIELILIMSLLLCFTFPKNDYNYMYWLLKLADENLGNIQLNILSDIISIALITVGIGGTGKCIYDRLINKSSIEKRRKEIFESISK